MSAGWPLRVPRQTWVLLYAPWTVLVVWPWIVVSSCLASTSGFLLSFLSTDLAFRAGLLWAKGLVRINLSRVTLAGFERVRRGQAYIVVSNHQSLFDVPALWSRWPLPFRFVMKQELRSVPFVGWYSAFLGNVFVDRHDRERALASLRAARATLDRGVSILFFAEGTRSPDGRLQAFKKGAFVMAMDAGLPILPVSISQTHRILPGKRLGLLPGHARITVHDPIPTAGLSLEERDALVTRVRAVVASGLTPYERGEDA